MAVVCLNEILSLSQHDYSEYKRKSQTLAKVLSKANGNDIMISIIKLITLSTLKKSIKWFKKKQPRVAVFTCNIAWSDSKNVYINF